MWCYGLERRRTGFGSVVQQDTSLAGKLFQGDRNEGSNPTNDEDLTIHNQGIRSIAEEMK